MPNVKKGVLETISRCREPVPISGGPTALYFRERFTVGAQLHTVKTSHIKPAQHARLRRMITTLPQPSCVALNDARV